MEQESLDQALWLGICKIMKCRMRIEYPDGTVHAGRKDFRIWTEWLDISDFDFAGLRVLDIATDEGWWAFWAEQRGAAYVEASDVERFEDYDWGWHRDKEFCDQHNAARGGRTVFDFHHANLRSKVVVKRQSIYDIIGEFDVVFCHGLLYHLRHPLLAIDRVRRVCDGVAIFETFVDIRADPMTASHKFYRTHELGPITNWSGPTTACVASWLCDAGFDHVYISDTGFSGPTRQMFVALADAQYRARFDHNANLHYCDDQYWQEVFERTRFQ